MENNFIVVKGVKHILVKNQELHTYYCDNCSLRSRCMLSRFPCHLYGVGIGWHFELASDS